MCRSVSTRSCGSDYRGWRRREAVFPQAPCSRPSRSRLARASSWAPRLHGASANRARTGDVFAGGGGCRVLTEVSGGDPGYDESSKMLAEAALCLAHDELAPAAGQLTAAAAMGDALIERLRSRGISFSTLQA